MAITGHFHPSDSPTFYEQLSRCQGIAEVTKIVQHALTVDVIHGFAETKGAGTKVHCPLPDECTVVLVKGSVRLDDENKDITEKHVGLQTRGSKTLTALSDSTVIWFPSVCCWDTSECALARKGQCRRAPGITVPRDPKNPMWWEVDTSKPKGFWKRKNKTDEKCVPS
ncbi:hypothetical protein DM02DRAFT_733485 [Periconia macrospinosa]|uniref:Uncharacterized protein n=1 Tax=Periconia macrospinosa TaxID=97972 RepID=A0A2V1D480_9PLEO|nr:hypothetical protein DM02DRAFT_733485 [Periconia macrospinosa]